MKKTLTAVFAAILMMASVTAFAQDDSVKNETLKSGAEKEVKTDQKTVPAPEGTPEVIIKKEEKK